MDEVRDLSTEELIADYTDLLAQYGAKSRDVERFLGEHSSNREFAELAQTARRLKQVYEEASLAASFPGESAGRRGFLAGLFDPRFVAVIVVAVLGMTSSYFVIQNAEATKQLSAQLESLQIDQANVTAQLEKSNTDRALLEAKLAVQLERANRLAAASRLNLAGPAAARQPVMDVYGDKVYAFVPSTKEIKAFDATNGRLIWSGPVVQYRAGTGVAIKASKDFVYLTTPDWLYEYEAKTGIVRAKVALPSNSE